MSRFGLVMPIHNAKVHLPKVLPPLELGPEWDIVLVDDGSTDGSAELARELLPQARIVSNPSALGPAQARNRGVREVKGDIIVFLDSDVRADASTIVELANFLDQNLEYGAVFGAYDKDPQCQTRVSRFRNLLHHYVHCHSRGAMPSFWSGFGAVRREAFESVDGFDFERFPQPSVEDIDLGSRLWKAGHKSFLEPSLQVTHLKAWTLSNFVKTDIFQRARPWTRMILEGRVVNDKLNLSGEFRRPIISLGLCLLFVFCGFWMNQAFGLALGSLAMYLSFNLPLYTFMAEAGLGIWSVLLLAIHHLCAITGAILAVLDHAVGILKSS